MEILLQLARITVFSIAISFSMASLSIGAESIDSDYREFRKAYKKTSQNNICSAVAYVANFFDEARTSHQLTRDRVEKIFSMVSTGLGVGGIAKRKMTSQEEELMKGVVYSLEYLNISSGLYVPKTNLLMGFNNTENVKELRNQIEEADENGSLDPAMAVPLIEAGKFLQKSKEEFLIKDLRSYYSSSPHHLNVKKAQDKSLPSSERFDFKASGSFIKEIKRKFEEKDMFGGSLLLGAYDWLNSAGAFSREGSIKIKNYSYPIYEILAPSGFASLSLRWIKEGLESPKPGFLDLANPSGYTEGGTQWGGYYFRPLTQNLPKTMGFKKGRDIEYTVSHPEQRDALLKQLETVWNLGFLLYSTVVSHSDADDKSAHFYSLVVDRKNKVIAILNPTVGEDDLGNKRMSFATIQGVQDIGSLSKGQRALENDLHLARGYREEITHKIPAAKDYQVHVARTGVQSTNTSCGLWAVIMSKIAADAGKYNSYHLLVEALEEGKLETYEQLNPETLESFQNQNFQDTYKRGREDENLLKTVNFEAAIARSMYEFSGQIKKPELLYQKVFKG